jgi:hypothetical protein
MVEAVDVLALGRCGVDTHPQQIGVRFEEVEAFGSSSAAARPTWRSPRSGWGIQRP